MKALIFLLLFPAALFSQSIEIFSIEENYYLRTIEVVENGTDIEDTISITKYLGDTSTYVAAIRNLDADNSNEYVRLLAKLQNLNQATRDRELTNAAETVDVDLDSLNDFFFGEQLMIDTLRMIVFPSRLSPADLALWTLDPNPPARLVFDAVVTRRNNGKLRISTILPQTHRLIMDGPRIFKLNNFPGASSFYKESENERSSNWRSVNVGPPVMRIVSFKVAANRSETVKSKKDE